jgi:hypothetical protein
MQGGQIDEYCLRQEIPPDVYSDVPPNRFWKKGEVQQKYVFVRLATLPEMKAETH